MCSTSLANKYFATKVHIGVPVISVRKLKMKRTLSFLSIGMAQPEPGPEPITSVGDLKRIEGEDVLSICK